MHVQVSGEPVMEEMVQGEQNQENNLTELRFGNKDGFYLTQKSQG